MQDTGFLPFGMTWFNSYLSERHQVVHLNNELSEPLPVESGVPQSSVQGLILLSIYVNVYHLYLLSNARLSKICI